MSDPAETGAPASGAERHRELVKSREYLGLGVGIGVIGVASAAVLGVTCPMCVVAAPAFIGAGVVKRWRARKK